MECRFWNCVGPRSCEVGGQSWLDQSDLVVHLTTKDLVSNTIHRQHMFGGEKRSTNLMESRKSISKFVRTLDNETSQKENVSRRLSNYMQHMLN